MKDYGSMATEDLLRKLVDLSYDGSLTASTFLSEAYDAGRLGEVDEDVSYWYRCLRCRQGDIDECWRMYLAGRRVTIEIMKYFSSDMVNTRRILSYTKKRDGEYIALIKARKKCREPALRDLPFMMHLRFYTDDPLELMIGLDREEAEWRLRAMALRGDARAAYDLRANGMDCEGFENLADTDPRVAEAELCRIFDIEEGGRDLTEMICDALEDVSEDAVPEIPGLVECVRHEFPEWGMLLAVWMYIGRIIPRDQDKALLYAVEAAEDGCDDAADLVALMVDHIPSTDRIRGDWKSGEELKACHTRCRKRMDRREDLCKKQRPYTAPSKESMEEGIEWRILRALTKTDCLGFTDSESRNDSGGFEDGVMSIRPYDQEGDGERAARPNFLFKPSGFNMRWYRFPWIRTEISENLSIGEIRRIWRLCIDHLLNGRDIPSGPTFDIVTMSPDRVDVPDNLRERVDRVCIASDKREMERLGVVEWYAGGDYVPKPTNPKREKKAKAIIAVLSERLGA